MRWPRRHDANSEEDEPGLAPAQAVADVTEDADDDALPCVRCQTPLVFVGERDFAEDPGAWELALGDLGTLFENSTRFEVWACQACGHVELFLPGVGE